MAVSSRRRWTVCLDVHARISITLEHLPILRFGWPTSRLESRLIPARGMHSSWLTADHLGEGDTERMGVPFLVHRDGIAVSKAGFGTPAADSWYLRRGPGGAPYPSSLANRAGLINVARLSDGARATPEGRLSKPSSTRKLSVQSEHRT